MKRMKWGAILGAALIAGMAWAAELSMAEARALIGECIANQAKMAEIVKQLSPTNQLTFVSEVNEAISKMPGSNEAKAAAYLTANRAAVTAAASGNKTAMLAEVFATVPPEVLTIVNERFAADLLNIDADPSRKITPEDFTRIALNIMEKVNERCASVANPAERATFAVLMLIRASNSTIPSLTEALVKTLPAASQNIASKEWIPAALGRDQTKSYEPLLGGIEGVGDMVANNVVIRLVGPQLLEALLGDIVEGTPLINNSNMPDLSGAGLREAETKTQPPVDPTKEPGNESDEPEPYPTSK